MPGEVPHRKQVRHYDLPHHAHFLTFSCFQRWPLLTRPDWNRQLSLAIDRAVTGHGFLLVAFVYMPEHIHLLVYPTNLDARVEQLLFAIKRPFSYRIKQQLVEEKDPLLERLTVRERPGKYAFRF